MAIPPSVTREVQDVSSLVATPLTNVSTLPLTVFLILAFKIPVGMSQVVRLPQPLLLLGLILQCLLPPPCLRLWCLCQLLSQILSVLHLFSLINSRYPPSRLAVITSRLGI